MGVNVSDADLLNAMGMAPKDVSDADLMAQMGGSAPIAAAKTSSKPTPSKASTVADVIRTIPGGLVKGAAAVAGLPGDINALMDFGANKLTGANIRTGKLPTSSEIGNAIADPFGGFYEPKTMAGKYADTISQFAPAALAPGNALLRAGRVAVPAVASEAAGEQTEGTPLEGPARLGGALLGAGAVGGARALLAPKTAIPTTREIKTAATAAYTRAEQAGVIVKQSEIQNLGSTIAHDVENAGIDPTLHPKAVAAVNRIVNSTGDLTLKKIDILRRVANGAAGSLDKDESRIAHIVLDRLDDFVENLGPGQVLAGNTADAAAAIKDARSLWAKQAKSTTIDSLLERAKNRAETVGGSGLENAIRVEFRGLAQSEKRMARFTPEEQSAIRTVARGGTIGNVARTLGKLAPTNLIAMLGEMGAIAHDPKALAIPVVGAGGRTLASALTKRNALTVSKMVRSGSAAPQQTFTPELLTSILGRNQQNQQQSNPLFPAYAGAQ